MKKNSVPSHLIPFYVFSYFVLTSNVSFCSENMIPRIFIFLIFHSFSMTPNCYSFADKMSGKEVNLLED